jgi:hypothetical protein
VSCKDLCCSTSNLPLDDHLSTKLKENKRFKITIGFKNKHKGLNIKPIRGSITNSRNITYCLQVPSLAVYKFKPPNIIIIKTYYNI